LTGYCREQLLPGIRQGPSRFTHRGGSPVFNEGELTAKRGGLTVQEYR
jgi:hypothetical protein